MDPQNLKDTATILKFFDRLFDSVNASTLFNKSRKEYKWAASVHSGHIPFWREARGALQNMFFKNLQSGQREIPHSLKNWSVTLRGLEEIVTSLKDLDFNFLLTRNINQDPLEIFFCQEKGSADILSSVKMFVTQGVAEEAEVEPLINFNEFVIPSYDYSYLTKISLGYVSGFIVKKLKLPCETCKSNVVCTDAIAVWHNLSLEKEYVDKVPKKLKYCTPKFLRLLCQYYNITS
jgi:hypothetical protein